LTLELHDVGKIGMTLVAALEGTELLCTIVSDTCTGTIILPQCHYQVFALVPEVDQVT
jgi:hypothetical protein